METASVDTAYQHGSSQRGNSLASISPSSSTQQHTRRRSDAGPAHISIDIPPTPSVPPSAASSYDSTQYASQAAPVPSQIPSEATAITPTVLTSPPAALQAPAAMPTSVHQQPGPAQLPAIVQPRQEAASLQSPPGGLLGQLSRPATDPSTAASEDLLSWLDMKDRQVVPPLLGGVNAAARQASLATQEEPSALFKHQEAAEVCEWNSTSVTCCIDAQHCLSSG